MNFKNNFNKLLSDYNLSETYISQKLNINKSKVTDWKKGNRTPDLQEVEKICTFFNITIKDLLDLEDNSFNYSIKISQLQKRNSFLESKIEEYNKNIYQLKMVINQLKSEAKDYEDELRTLKLQDFFTIIFFILLYIVHLFMSYFNI